MGDFKTLTMKIYTKEQVKIAMLHSYLSGVERPADYLPIEEDILNELTPIELPSDEEIDNQADFSFPYAERIGGETYSAFLGMKVGAKWMKEQILNQNK